MNEMTNKIFKGSKHYVTSGFGPRTPIITKYGTTSNFHYGTDYGTDLKKVPQYALGSGKVLEAGHTTSYGNYVWIEYPRLNVKMCHLHLDKVCVKAGQVVDNDTIIGYTGTTGYSTGIHLHLGVYDLSKKCYVDPEEFAKTYSIESSKTKKLKSLDDIAKDVIDGKYGNYPERKTKLELEGYDFSTVQTKVNEILNGKAPNSKSIDELAKEVINGNWGDGAKRKKKLTSAGYDYNKIQARVNEILKSD